MAWPPYETEPAAAAPADGYRGTESRHATEGGGAPTAEDVRGLRSQATDLRWPSGGDGGAPAARRRTGRETVLLHQRKMCEGDHSHDHCVSESQEH